MYHRYIVTLGVAEQYQSEGFTLVPKNFRNRDAITHEYFIH